MRSNWPECQDFPLTLRAGELRRFQVPKADQELFGYEIQIDRIVLPNKTSPPVLRLLHGNAYFTEIMVDKPGSYFAHGPIGTSKGSQLGISHVNVWPLSGESEISISKVRPLLEQLVQTQSSDWVNYSETSFKESQNANRVLKSIDPLGIVIETSTHFQRYVRKSAIEAFTFLQEAGLLEQLTRSRLIPPFQISETFTRSFPLCLHVPRGWEASPYLTPSLLISLIETWLDIDEQLLDIGSSPYCLIDFNYANFASFGNGHWQLVDFGSMQPCPNFGTGLDSVVKDVLPVLKLRESNPQYSIGLLRHLWLTGHDFETGILCTSDLKEIQQWLSLEFIALTSVQSRKDFLNKIRGWLKALSLEVRNDFWSTYEAPISKQIKRFESKLPAVKPELSRDDVIASILNSIPGTTLLDLGSASGRFTALAAQLGFDVLAIDANEPFVDTISTQCRYHSSLSFSARAVEISSSLLNELTSRYNADVVLCLALAHHLLLANFSAIKRVPISIGELVGFLADLTTHFLLVEFMPLGMVSSANNCNPVPDPLPVGYSLPNFAEHLSARFTDVNIINYRDPNHHHRVLLVCEK